MGDLRQEILLFCRQQGVVLSGKTVLCAVSGGRDSMALLHIFLKLGEEQGFAVAAAHYNHRLRETADRDEAFVRSWCAKNGVPHTVGEGDVAAFARERKTSVENAARTMRYRFLESAADEMGADFIATAHHADDNAETVLLHLLRGAGLQGICGIPPVRDRIIRPLLGVERKTIDAYIAENSIPFVEDETNCETVYERNRIRHRLMPVLEQMSPGSGARIAAAAARLRLDNAYMERQAEDLLPPAGENGETAIPRALLKAQDAAIAARLVRLAARRLGAELTAAQTDAVLALRTGAVLSLPTGIRSAADGKSLHFYRIPSPPPPMMLRMGEQTWGEYRITLWETDGNIGEDKDTAVLSADVGDLTVAAWNGSGRLTVDSGKRTVKRLLSDHGVPVPQQENRPALFADGILCAVFGAGTDLAFRPPDGGKRKVVTLVKEDNSNDR